MTRLSFVSHHDKTWLVGIAGKDIRKSQTSGGKVGDVPYMAIGNDQLSAAPTMPSMVPCRECGELLPVKHAEGKPV